MIKKGITLTVLILIAMLAGSLYGWLQIPDDRQVAIHWNAQGEADGFTNKANALLISPAITIALIVILAIAPLLDPRRKNLEQSSAFYLTAWVGSVSLMALSHAAILMAAITGKQPSIQLVLIFSYGFFIVIGNFMAKSRSNWFAGLRTPWTLSSEHAWSVGNRLAGMCFVISGIAAIILVVMNRIEDSLLVLIAGCLLGVIGGSFASYIAWRSDPER